MRPDGRVHGGLPGGVLHRRQAERDRRHGARRDLLGAAHDRRAGAVGARRVAHGARPRGAGARRRGDGAPRRGAAWRARPHGAARCRLAPRLAAGLAYALYVVLAKATLARMAPLPLTALTFTAGAV